MTKRDGSSKKVDRKRSAKSELLTPKKPKIEELLKQWDELDEQEEKKLLETKDDPTGVDQSRSCPYLDTINRNMLDFDFEKLCSISLSHLNVYACLVCGKYFQGRGSNTHAHTHSVNENHHVFLNLETHRFYCLPDNYEIVDGSLEDITYLLNPIFQKDDITKLDTNASMVRAYNGLTYYPGFVGLNNIKANDYCNVILQLLSHISLLRDFFLRPENYQEQIKRASAGDHMTLLVHRFGELIRKLWNPRNFKTHVSPHEFLQAVVLCSKKRFQFTEQGDALEFLSWLLNALDQTLRPVSKGQPVKPTIIGRALRGRMVIHSQKVTPVNITPEQAEQYATDPEYMPRMTESPFLYLTCDLPPPPLYLDEFKESIIPQVPLSTLLAKFNGVMEKEYKTHCDSTMRRFCLKRLPPYLILFMKRIVKNIFTLEKNPTIVNFPIKSIDFGELLDQEARAQHKYTIYDLVANVVHDGPPTPGAGTHRIFVLQRGTGKWFEMQDLHVNEVLPQMIPLSESLIQVWAVNKTIPNPFYKDKKTKKTDEKATDENGNQKEAGEEA
ncbi:U4/U6.U5 tri-snRNP-associated protein 2 [Echinococcus granulosus]|uniref:ubiquitinyl hydrolase 1 n=1 Tax=Echinococcus granulosus TaxID=6210 RepID=U6J7T0_ECHGR|nr:U4/U6.U5 tri-snRNP-associated protein 2 [Echinococcus granulosus]EUB62340.1 U4/U6.U5 tri-snRNP-associated protein 2 [Echinococcus granulosus]KAH9282183.1 U4/U6.U5 tri-snRNP-associated protein 2 [Echinococcus granulosus]CDS18487.1 u4:u6.u5 tri snrnp associated protein 2 [Echinococcus granulosus]